MVSQLLGAGNGWYISLSGLLGNGGLMLDPDALQNGGSMPIRWLRTLAAGATPSYVLGVTPGMQFSWLPAPVVTGLTSEVGGAYYSVVMRLVSARRTLDPLGLESAKLWAY